ncbi:RNA polymerase sigma-70 factor (ECF subfamily) [Acidovorax soli]|uniref:RNA polymerase sigma-70 factor (ECF subfamily) n=1 Tax=Acidovorax soli TaxID=592050 RepID=A0A7X0PLE7_9BURK|nr:sigma-70 family RNA polymerase sigma factor [Acidovorax soli]MBB6564093.1 RNA polymerase sigma-70 factor (ECF subfamily) [Acidovorax soli]
MPERYYRELLRYFTRRAGNGDTAADVVQEAYSRVLALQSTGKPVFEPRALLYQTARNVLTNQALRRAAEVRMLDTLALVHCDSAPSVEREVSARQQLHRLLALLQRMPRKRRDAFILVRVHGMSHAQTAAHMEISTKAVERHITRALLDCAGYTSARD